MNQQYATVRSSIVKTGQGGLPGCQSGLHALRQGAGGGGFIELVLWSGQRSQHAHCNSTNITMKRQIHTRTAERQRTKVQLARTSLRGGVAVCVLDDQVVQVRLLAFGHHKLAPVIHRQSQQTLHNLNRKKELVKMEKIGRYFSVLPHPLPTVLSWLRRSLGQDRGELLKMQSIWYCDGVLKRSII